MNTLTNKFLMKKRSNVWNHFTLTSDNFAKCNYCSEKKSFAGGSTGNLIRHMKTKHVTVPLQRSIQNSEHVDDPQPSTSSSELQLILTSNSSLSASVVAASSSKTNTRIQQQPISNFIQRPLPLSKSQAIDQQLIKMIVKEYHPFSIVEDKEFRNLINILSPSYIIPSRKTVSNSLLPQMYEAVVQKVKLQLQNVSAVCLTTDGWTSRNNQSFVAVTAHFLNSEKETELSTVLLGCNSFPLSHTSENIASFLKDIVSEWGLNQNIAAVVTDNAANMKLAITNCGWRRLSCFAHTINLIVQSGLSIIEDLLIKVKNIVSYFKRSSHALAKLQDLQKQTGSPVLKLKQDCPTRWNSTYDMLDRVLKLKEPIIGTLAILNNTDLNSLSGNDWEVIDKVKDLLKIFDDVTNEVSGEKYITISKEIIFINALTKYTDKFTKNITLPKIVLDIATNMKRNISIRFGTTESNVLIAQATLLDPRFKKHGFINEEKCSAAINELRKKIQTIRTEQDLLLLPSRSPTTSIPVSNTEIWGEFDKSIVNIISGNNSTTAGIIEIDKYLAEPLLSRHANPLLWWSLVV